MNKSEMLGMSFSTARSRLERDILFDFVKKSGKQCFRCGKKLVRNNFSIDHKKTWSRSKNPRKTFFNVKNVAFSHHDCNSGFTSRNKHASKEAAYVAHLVRSKNRRRRIYSSESRRKRYESTGH